MFKSLKNKLIIMFLAVAVVGGVSTKILFMHNNAHITISKSQASNIKETYIDDATVISKEVDKNDTDKELNLVSDTKDLSDNSQHNNINIDKQETIGSKSEQSNNNTNKQEAVSPKLEQSSNNNTNKQDAVSPKLEQSSNNSTNKQDAVNSKLEQSSNNSDTNKQTADSAQLKNENSNINTEKQGNTNAALEKEIPTIHYDRTTSIYTNDCITLLRIEYYKNNKLTYYSVIEQFDAETKSYIEKIYQCNRDTNIDPLIRTDVYVNGKLIKSY